MIIISCYNYKCIDSVLQTREREEVKSMARKIRRASTVKKHRVATKKKRATAKHRDSKHEAKKHLKVEVKVHHKY